MSFRGRPDTRYLKHPLRTIVTRVTYYSPELPPYPVGYFVEPTLVLECGHQVADHGQKARVRCWQCGESPEEQS